MVIKYVPMILAGVALNALAQLLLKKGMIRVGEFGFSQSELLRIVPTVGLNPYVVGGLLSYVLSVGIWLLVLSRVNVSIAYPFLSVGYVVVTLGGWLFFAEQLSAAHALAIVFICLGVVLLARS